MCEYGDRIEWCSHSITARSTPAPLKTLLCGNIYTLDLGGCAGDIFTLSFQRFDVDFNCFPNEFYDFVTGVTCGDTPR